MSGTINPDPPKQASRPRVWLLSAEIMTQLGGGCRQQRWCEYFLELGWSVRIYCLTGLFSVQATDCHSVAELRTLRTAWLRNAPARSGHRDSPFVRVARFIKHVFLFDLIYPCIWILFRKLWQALRAEDRKVLFLCSSPPFSLAVVCALIKCLRGPAVIYALDMRDYWSLHGVRARFKWHKMLIERFVMRHVDRLTTIGHTMSLGFLTAFNKNAAVAYNVATHISVSRLQESEQIDWSTYSCDLKRQTRKIVYTGSIPEGYYDLEAFVNGCLLILKERPEIATKVQFVFIGACRELQRRVKKHAGLSEFIVFIQPIAHNRSVEAQRAADGLLFMGLHSENNMGQVSMKIFEYFRNMKPILPLFVRPGSDVDILIKKYCGSTMTLCVDTAVAAVIRKILDEGCSRLPIPQSLNIEPELLHAYEVVVSELMMELKR